MTQNDPDTDSRLFEVQKALTGRTRSKRWGMLLEQFPEFAEMRVLDLGGTPKFWANAPVHPVHVTSVNLGSYTSEDPRVTVVHGDAIDLPPEVTRETYDVVLSNSLLEHLGGPAMRARFADTVHRMADRHWVQTPYRYFPVEPHWLFPGMQFLPWEARVQVSMRWHRGHMRTKGRAAAIEKVNEVELVGVSQMRSLFPRSEVLREQWAGITKSLVAAR